MSAHESVGLDSKDLADLLLCRSASSACNQSVSKLNFSDNNDRPFALRVSSCPDSHSLRPQKAGLTCNLNSLDFSDPIQTYDSRVCIDRSFALKLTRAATDPGCLKPDSDEKIDGVMPQRTANPPRYEMTASAHGKKRLPFEVVKNRWRNQQIADQLRVSESPGPLKFWSNWVPTIPRLPFTKTTRRN